MTAAGAMPSLAWWPTHWDGPVNVVPTSAAAIRIIAECRDRDKVMLAHIAAARIAGRKSAVGRAVRRYLGSASAQINALANAFIKKFGRLADLPSDDLRAIVLIAPEVSAWHADQVRPVARPLMKRDGVSIRWIRTGSVFQYARELMCCAAAAVASPSLPTQFMSKGRGGQNRFEGWLRERLPTSKLVITIDVPRCFATMKHGSVADALPLPPKVIEQVLFVPMERTKYLTHGPRGLIPADQDIIAQASSPNRGIAEGSALSSLASEFVLAAVLRDVASLGEGIHVASHGDNLIVLVDDAELKEPAVHALVSSICKQFDVTPGELAGRIQTISASQEFAFCRRLYRWQSGKLRLRLPPGYIDEFALRIMDRINSARATPDPQLRDETFGSIHRSIMGWVGQSKASSKVIQEAVLLLKLLPDTG